MGKKEMKKGAKPVKGKDMKKPQQKMSKPVAKAKPLQKGKPVAKVATKPVVKGKSPAPKKVEKKPLKQLGKPAPKMASKPLVKGKPAVKQQINVKGKKDLKPTKHVGKDLTSKIQQKIALSASKKKEQDKKKVVFDKKQKPKQPEKPVAKKDLKLLEKQKSDEKLKGKKIDRGDDRDIVGELMKKKSVVEAVKEEISEEIVGLAEEFAVKEIFEAIKSLDFFKNEADDCLEKGCDNPATTLGYCRYHYIKDWKDIQKKKVILSEGKLHSLIEELAKKYPIRFIQAILDDLIDEKSFHAVLTELNIESDEFEDADDEVDDDEVDIAFETKTLGKASFDEDP